MLFSVLTVVYALSLTGLLWVARKNKKRYALAKGVCSGLFLACGLLAGLRASGVATAGLVLFLSALCLCAFGDVMLGIANQTATRPSRRPFLVGAVSFATAHIVFCLFFYSLLPFHWADIAVPACFALLMALLEKKGLVRLKKIKPLAYLYTVLVALMAGKAVQLLFLGGPGNLPGRAALCMGAMLFLVSDCILLFLYFGASRPKWLRPANLITYYGGVYLMSISLYWL